MTARGNGWRRIRRIRIGFMDSTTANKSKHKDFED